MRVVAKLEWRGGYVLLSLRGGDLILEFGNGSIVLGNREIEVSGVDASLKRFDVGDSSFIYLYLSRELDGVRAGHASSRMSERVDLDLGSYAFSYTKLEGLGYYITVRMPADSLYDFAIITPSVLAIRTPSKRRAYTMTSDSSYKIFLL